MRLLVLVLVLCAGACAPDRERPHLTMATTTSVGNSGLLDVLRPAYERETGVRLDAHLVGSGRALAMLEDGTADLVITHAPQMEAVALARHPGWRYRKIMFNDFVVAGPRDDPAGAAAAGDVVDAMRRIAASGTRFISRGDQSGTHEREQDLWRRARHAPSGDRLVAAGAGMGSTLRVASEAGAYTLTDRATYEQHAGSLRLRIVFEGGPLLVNTYAVIVDATAARATGGSRFAEWLAGGEGRRLIASYRGHGPSPLFRPWPEDDPAAVPSDVPRVVR